MGQEGDPDDADEDRPEIPQERAERRSRAFPVLQRLTDQREREEGAGDRRHDRREDRSAEPVPRCRGNGEQAEPQHERGDVHRRDRMKALAALQDSHRYGKDERRREGGVREQHRPGGVDVEQGPQRLGEGERDDDERHGCERREAECRAREAVGLCLISGCKQAGDLARHAHLQRAGRKQHDGEQSEQRGQGAVALAAEDAARREQKDVVRDDRDPGRDGKDCAATGSARRSARAERRAPSSRDSTLCTRRTLERVVGARCLVVARDELQRAFDAQVRCIPIEPLGRGGAKPRASVDHLQDCGGEIGGLRSRRDRPVDTVGDQLRRRVLGARRRPRSECRARRPRRRRGRSPPARRPSRGRLHGRARRRPRPPGDDRAPNELAEAELSDQLEDSLRSGPSPYSSSRRSGRLSRALANPRTSASTRFSRT